VRRRGFTLVEVIVVSILIAGIAAAVTVSISQALRAARVSESRRSAFARAEAAVARIARDVQNVIRDGDLWHARVRIVDAQAGGISRDELLVYTGSLDAVRPNDDAPEGGSYEVQYRAADAPADTDRRPRSGAGPARVPELQLWRRVDPIPDDTPLGGGVVFPVVNGITSLSIDAFDGEGWRTEWDSDRDGYPHAVRVIATAVSGDGARSAVARRVVAIDRTPAPYYVDHLSEPEEEDR
jgi:prepilin-type N-terminal cleavage/methylation domain-containing protein